MAESQTGLGWWAISGERLLGMLRQAAAAGDPDLVYAEEYANSMVSVPQEQDGDDCDCVCHLQEEHDDGSHD